MIPIQKFVHGVALGHLLGGLAVNVAAFVGFRLFGLRGAVPSAAAFLGPSLLLVLILSDLYFRSHAIPALQGTMAGLAPVVVALILAAAWSIGRQVLNAWQNVLIAAISLLAAVRHCNPAIVLLTAGAVGVFAHPRRGVSETGDQAISTPGAMLAARYRSFCQSSLYRFGRSS